MAGRRPWSTISPERDSCLPADRWLACSLPVPFGCGKIRYPPKAFQSIPCRKPVPARLHWQTQWIEQACLCQRRLHSTKIAGRARNDHVFKAALAATAVGQDMVILQPHALERRMLPGIAVRPGHRIRIFPVQQRSDCGVHNWYPAEAAMIAITFHHCFLRRRRRHPGNRTSVLCKVWWTIRYGNEPVPYPAAGTPGSVGILPHDRTIRFGEAAVRCFPITCQMCVDAAREQSRHFKDLRNGLHEAAAKRACHSSTV